MQSFYFSGSLNPLLKRNEEGSSCFKRQNSPGFLEYLSSLVLGYVFPPAILNAEKSLGIRLAIFNP